MIYNGLLNGFRPVCVEPGIDLSSSRWNKLIPNQLHVSKYIVLETGVTKWPSLFFGAVAASVVERSTPLNDWSLPPFVLSWKLRHLDFGNNIFHGTVWRRFKFTLVGFFNMFFNMLVNMFANMFVNMVPLHRCRRLALVRARCWRTCWRTCWRARRTMLIACWRTC